MNSIDYSSPFLQNLDIFIWFKLDDKLELVSMEGAIEKITGYNKDDFLLNKIKLIELVMPEYRQIFLRKTEDLKKLIYTPDSSIELEYNLKTKAGSIRWVREVLQRLPEGSANKQGKIQGFIEDITDNKRDEEILKEKEQAELKAFHNIIKKNLEIISVLLTLQAEKFTNRKVIEAFSKSQSRVASISLIHEELYNNNSKTAVNIADYLQKLASTLLYSHTLEDQEIKLKLDLEPLSLEIDKAIPLGIIANELILNSLKHAFPSGRKGEIQISFHKAQKLENNKNIEINKIPERKHNELQYEELKFEDFQYEELQYKELQSQNPSGQSFESLNKSQFIFTVSDNGIGFPEKLDFKTMDFLSSDSLGLQIINSLVEQIGGSVELTGNMGTRLTIKFYSDLQNRN